MKRIHWIWLLIFLGGIFLLEVVSIRNKTFTADEEHHYGYGWNILMLNADSRVEGNGTLMPFNSMNALPRLIGRQLPSSGWRDFLTDINTGRYVTMLFSLLLAFYVFKWSRDLYGDIAGYFSLLLFAFSPNIIAHSRLITNDTFAACLMIMTLYYFWKFLSSRRWKFAAITAVLTGISQITKYSMLSLFPIFIVIIVFNHGKLPAIIIRTGRWKILGTHLFILAKYTVFFLLITLLFINIGFLFHGTFTPLSEYHFKSLAFQNLQSRAGFLGEIPIPLPTLYLEGPDDRKWEEETGEHGNNYLFGERRNPGYFIGYFFWAYLYKVPLALQFIMLLSLIAYLKNRREYSFSKNEIFLCIPVLLFAIYLNFFPFIQSGIRFIILVFPLLLVFAGNLVKNWEFFTWRARLGIGALVAYLVISVLSYFPHYLCYFNELVPDRKMAYKILADSNLEWGQNRGYFEEYLKEHPEVMRFPKAPTAGRIGVPVNKLVGIFRPRECRWLRDNFEPVDHVAYSFLIFDVSPEALAKAMEREREELRKEQDSP